VKRIAINPPFGGRACAALLVLLTLLSIHVSFVQAVTEERAGKPIQFNAIAPPATQQAAAPNASRSSFDVDAVRVIMALAGVLGLIFMLRWGGKKVLPATMGGARTGAVKVLARCPLAHRQQVVLLQIGKRIIVAADCASQLSSLCQITDADEVAAILGSLQAEKTSPASAFSSWFSQARHAFGMDEVEKEVAHPAEDNADMEPPAAERETERIADLTERVRELARKFGGPGSVA
jgi:flagellar biogenesis protein FliO